MQDGLICPALSENDKLPMLDCIYIAKDRERYDERAEAAVNHAQ